MPNIIIGISTTQSALYTLISNSTFSLRLSFYNSSARLGRETVKAKQDRYPSRSGDMSILTGHLHIFKKGRSVPVLP
jgi:hypothetical protein